jgi:hypothetical protein
MNIYQGVRLDSLAERTDWFEIDRKSCRCLVACSPDFSQVLLPLILGTKYVESHRCMAYALQLSHTQSACGMFMRRQSDLLVLPD